VRSCSHARLMICFSTVMPGTPSRKLNRSARKLRARPLVNTRAQAAAMENEGQGQTQARSEIHRPPSAPRNAVIHVPLRKGGRVFLWRKPSETSARHDRRMSTDGHVEKSSSSRRRGMALDRRNAPDGHDSDRRGEHQYPGDENGPDSAPSDRDDLKKRMREAKGASFRS